MSNQNLPGHILLVDDEEAYQRLGSAYLADQGHHVSVAGDADEALRIFGQDRPQVVLLDLAMPPRMQPEAGLEMIPRFAPALVIVLTGHADRDLALRSVELGAWDFLAKPIDPEMLRFVVARALAKAQLEAELRALQERAADDDLGLFGQSAAMQSLRAMVRRVAPTEVSVLVLGPTGTGKELVACALHRLSQRSQGPFGIIHCGALSAELLESELFGHLKGSFTGAYRDQPGLLETANDGTLFLDEVGEMPASMQVKLLRFLQEGTFVPVGGRVAKKASVRVVAATHRDLEAMVREGTFREDLYYRLKGVVLRTPSLSERAGDVPLLAARFLNRVASRARLGTDAIAWVCTRDWQGNVRELRSVVESAAALLSPGEEVIGADLMRLAAGEAISESAGTQLSHPRDLGLLDAAVLELETRLIKEAMAATDGNQSEAARRLGISRPGLIKKLVRLGLR